MAARNGVENRIYKKRRSVSFLGQTEQDRTRLNVLAQQHSLNRRDSESVQNACSTSEVDSSTPLPTKKNRRRPKSTSVCVATIQMELEKQRGPPRTMNDFQFLNPEVLTMQSYEVQSVRLPALSTSEVFHEPPPMYLYRPVPQTGGAGYAYAKPRRGRLVEWARKRKHTLIAWTFGIVAVSLMIVVVAWQTSGDFK